MNKAMPFFDFFLNSAEPHENSTVNKIGWGATSLTGLAGALIWSNICKRAGIPTTDENPVIIGSTGILVFAAAAAALIARRTVLEVNDHFVRPFANRFGYQLGQPKQ